MIEQQQQGTNWNVPLSYAWTFSHSGNQLEQEEFL